MTTFPILRLLLLAMLLQISCFGSKRSASPETSGAYALNDITMRNNSFAFDIFSVLEKEIQENLIISPFSISNALAMVYPGASGETARQISKTLHFNPDIESFAPEFSNWAQTIAAKGAERNQFSVANALWPQANYPFHQAYIGLIHQWFQSALFPVDYMDDREAIRLQINQWVASQTQDLILELIKPGVLVEDTRLVLVNAIYFLSAWQTAFDKRATHSAPFFIEPQRSVQTSMMYMKHPLPLYEGEGFQLLELPYEGTHFSMLVLLPAEGLPLGALLDRLNGEKWEEMTKNLAEKEVEVFFPSFQTRTQIDMEEVLISMGMPLAFSNKADFSAMTSLNDLKIDKVIHQSYIEVKEEGTEAAASTAVVMIRKTAIEEPVRVPVFRANRPFIYMIRETSSNAILFIGKTQNPTLRSEP